MRCKEYLKTLYNLCFENNTTSFIGTKKLLKFKMQLNLKYSVDDEFFDKTLECFRSLGLMENTITYEEEVQFIIDNKEFIGIKMEFPAIKVSENILEKKLDRIEKILKRDFYSKVSPVITEEELDYINKLQKTKMKLCKDVVGTILDELFFFEYEKEYGIWIYDLEKEKYLKDCEKLRTYNKDYFKLKLRKYKDMDIERTHNKANHFYKDLMDKVVVLLDKMIYNQDEVTLSICNKENSSLYVENRVNIVKYSKDVGMISFESSSGFYCKIEISGVYIDENNLINIHDNMNNITILEKITSEERKEFETFVNVYEKIYGESDNNRKLYEIVIGQ